MTDTTVSAPSIASQIDSMVSGSARNTAPVTIHQNRGGMKLDNEGNFTTYGEQSPTTSDGARIPDMGQDTAATGAQIVANIAALDAKLAEKVYDPTTGRASDKITGIERDRLEAASRQAKLSAAYDLERLNALNQQRANDKARELAQQAEQHASIRFANGDPKRAAALADAMLAVEAEEAARALVAARRRS